MPGLPLAVDPSNPSPGLYLTVDLLRATTSPGAAGLNCLMISPPQTGVGNQVVGTEVRAVFSADDVEAAMGRGLGWLAYKALIANDPNALVDLIVAAEPAGVAATGTLTFAGTPSVNEVYDVYIQGVQCTLSFNVGDTLAQARDNNFPVVNAQAADLYVVASAGGAGIINLTANSKGLSGNDVTLRVVKRSGTGGTLTASGAKLAGGTLEPDFTTALSTAQGKEYDHILACLSNSDAQSATGNPQRLSTHIDTYKSGSNAKLQQATYGNTGSIASSKTNTAARNHTNLEIVNSVGDESLPCELAAAELGDRMRRRRRESNANRVLQPLKRVRGSADKVGDQPTDPERIDALGNGVTLIAYTASGQPMVLRSVTTHSKDTLGNIDRRAFDTSEVDALYDYAKDLRAAIPQEFLTPDGQVKIAKNRVAGDEDLPQGVVEERDVRSFIINRTLSFWVPKGVIDGVKFQAVVDDGTLQVKVNASDPNQVDVFIPAVAFKILAKIGVYLAKVG